MGSLLSSGASSILTGTVSGAESIRLEGSDPLPYGCRIEDKIGATINTPSLFLYRNVCRQKKSTWMNSLCMTACTRRLWPIFVTGSHDTESYMVTITEVSFGVAGIAVP